MNEEARAELDRILALEPAALTDADRAFLQARRDYLTEEQQAAYVLLDEPSSGDSEKAQIRKGRKVTPDSDESEA